MPEWAKCVCYFKRWKFCLNNFDTFVCALHKASYTGRFLCDEYNDDRYTQMHTQQTKHTHFIFLSFYLSFIKMYNCSFFPAQVFGAHTVCKIHETMILSLSFKFLIIFKKKKKKYCEGETRHSKDAKRRNLHKAI